jgi:hypothetical protein
MSLADSNNDNILSEEELNSLNKANLIAYANELGIEGINSKSTKADIISLILNS